MKSFTTVCFLLSLLAPESQQMRLKYKSDDMDDLLEGVITNKHLEKNENKPKGAVDELVQEAYDKAMTENPVDPRMHAQKLAETKLSTEEEWAKLM